MATESNSGFRQEDTLGSALHRRVISFEFGDVNNTSEMIRIGNCYGMSSNPGNLMFCDNSGIIGTSSPSTATAVNPSSSVLLDSVPGLKHDEELAVEWTEEEQFKLEEGLVKFKNVPSIMKYIKIAATLREKTVRDVVLRSRWMGRKRRKQEESHVVRKGNYRKDKLVESSSKININLPSTSTPNIAAFSHPTNQMDRNHCVKFEVLSSKAKRLLEQNLQAFNQINNNLSSLKLPDNIDLFCHTRDNIDTISSILNDMRQYPGKLNLMQELPVFIDQNLANCILPYTPPIMAFGMINGIQPKQESGC